MPYFQNFKNRWNLIEIKNLRFEKCSFTVARSKSVKSRWRLLLMAIARKHLCTMPTPAARQVCWPEVTSLVKVRSVASLATSMGAACSRLQVIDWRRLFQWWTPESNLLPTMTTTFWIRAVFKPFQEIRTREIMPTAAAQLKYHLLLSSQKLMIEGQHPTQKERGWRAKGTVPRSVGTSATDRWASNPLRKTCMHHGSSSAILLSWVTQNRSAR